MNFLGSLVNIGAAFATGGAALYWQIAAVAYGVIKGGPEQKGPRLNDLTITLDGEGQAISRGWGRWRQEQLRLLWTTGLLEDKSSKRKGGLFGIGGTKITSYKYSASGLLLGGKGPVTRLRRLQLNQHVEYDYGDGDEKGLTLTWNGQFWSSAPISTALPPPPSLFSRWGFRVNPAATSNANLIVRVYPGTLAQPVDSLLVAAKGADEWTNYPDKWIVAVEIKNLEKYGNSMPRISVEMEYAQTDLAEVILEVASWVGLEAADFDLSALEGLSVATNGMVGFQVDSRRKACDIIGELMDIYHFSLPEVDGVLRAVRRPSGFLVELDENALRVRAGYEAGEVAGAPLSERDEESLSRDSEYLFRDPNREFAPGYRYSRRFDAATTRKNTQQTGASMEGSRASSVIRVLQAEEWAGARGRKGTRGLEALIDAAGDEGWIATPDGAVPMVLDQTDVPLFGPVGETWQGLDPLVYNLPLRDETAGLTRRTPIERGFPIVWAGECSFVEGSGAWITQKSFVIGVCRSIGDLRWNGADVEIERREPGGDWIEVAETGVGDESIIGELTAPWTPTEGFSSDGFSCQLYGGALTSTTEALALSGANLALFENGMAVVIQTATQTAANANSKFYSTTNLTSGIYGTDDFLEPLAAGARFIILNDANALPLDGPEWKTLPTAPVLGSEFRLIVQEDGAQGEEVVWTLGEFEGENIRTPSPAVEATRDIDGGLSLVVAGRTRYLEDMDLDALPSGATYRETSTPSGFKFQIILTCEGASVTVTHYSTDERAEFDFAWTAGELATLLSLSEAQIAANEITGTLALWGATALGRAANFSASPLNGEVVDENYGFFPLFESWS